MKIRDAQRKSNGGLLYSTVVSITYLLYVFKDQIYSLIATEQQVVPLEFRQDANLYLGQINLALRSQSISDNPFWLESQKGDQNLVGKNIFLYMWGSVTREGNLNLITSYFLLVACCSFAMAFIFCKYFEVYIPGNNTKCGVALLCLMGTLGEFAFRPSPTELGLPILCFVVCSFWNQLSTKKSHKAFLLSLVYLCILFFVNPFYCIFFFFFVFGAVLLFYFKSSKVKLITTVLLTSVLISSGDIFASIIIPRLNSDLVFRWGLLESHFPGSMNSTLALLAVIVILKVKKWQGRDAKSDDFLLIFALATIMSLQQNLLSGIWWEPESHYRYLVNIVVLLSAMSFIRSLNYRLEKVKFVAFAFVLITFPIFVIGYLVPGSGESRFPSDLMNIKLNSSMLVSRTTELESLRLRLLSRTTNESEVLITNSTVEESGLLSLAALLAERRLVWSYEGSLLSGSNRQILHRFFCASGRDEIEAISLDEITRTQGHRFVNSLDHFSKWYEVKNLFLKTKIDFRNVLENREKDILSQALPFSKEAHCPNMQVIQIATTS